MGENKGKGKIMTMVKLEASYVEIYNENCCDLLRPGKERENLKVREHPQTGAYVEGLTSVAVDTLEDIESIMRIGSKSRTVASTNMNARSSRSHAIFTLVFTQTKIAADMSAAIDTVSKINLVDLAGSERVAASGVAGSRLKETANINKSLHMLGRVISALANLSSEELDSREGSSRLDENSSPNTGKKNRRKKAQKIIPYRDSTLTWLLKPSLGGNSKTTMFVTVSPACFNYDETLTTLRYANDCARIVNNAVVNRGSNTEIVAQLRLEIDLLRERLEASAKASVSDDGRTIGDLLGELEELKIVESNIKKEKMKLHEDKENLTLEKKQYLERMEELKQQNIDLRDDVSTFSENVKMLEKMIAEKNDELKAVRLEKDSQISDFESLIGMKNEEISKVKKKHSTEMSRLRSNLNEEIKHNEEQVQKSLEDMAQLEKTRNEEALEIKREHDVEVDNLEREIEELEMAKSELHEKYDKMKQNIQELGIKLKTSEDKNSEFSSKISALNKEFEKLQEDNQSLQSELATISSEVSEWFCVLVLVL